MHRSLPPFPHISSRGEFSRPFTGDTIRSISINVALSGIDVIADGYSPEYNVVLFNTNYLFNSAPYL